MLHNPEFTFASSANYCHVYYSLSPFLFKYGKKPIVVLTYRMGIFAEKHFCQ